MPPCLSKRKRGEDRQEKPCPARGWRETLQLNVRVCLVLILLRLERHTHTPVWSQLFVTDSFSCASFHLARAQPSEPEEQKSHQLLLSLPWDITACLRTLWFCCQGTISKLGASDAYTDTPQVCVIKRVPLSTAIRELLKQGT